MLLVSYIRHGAMLPVPASEAELSTVTILGVTSRHEPIMFPTPN